MPIESKLSIAKTAAYFEAFIIPFAILGPVLFVFPDYLRPVSSILFVGGIVLSAWYFGFKPGVITTVLSAFLSAIFFVQPYQLYALLTVPGVLKITLFLIVGIIINYAIDSRTEKSKILEYKQLNSNLKKTITELEIQNEKAQKEINSRDEFLSIASHELKTPLTSMLLQTQHAIHNIKNVSLANFSIDSLLRILENAENQTKRLSRMINDLLNISLITTGNMQLEYENVDLNILVASVIHEFTPKITKDGYKVQLFEREHIQSSWDKIRIEQAFSNLISNALKYGNGKPIIVTIKKHRNSALIEVEDQGIGISHDKQKSIFDLFERGNNINKNNEDQKGLGVGLFITRQIVEAHNGSIKVESTHAKGSKFIIQLPINPLKKGQKEITPPEKKN